MEALPTFTSVRLFLVGSLLAAGGLGSVASVGADTVSYESSGTRALESTGLYVSVPLVETPTAGSVEEIDPRYVRHGQIGLVTVHAESDDRFADAVWALSRFSERGMPVPEVHVLVAADFSECGGSAGYLTFVGDERQMWIRACGSRFTLLHEFGHAWDIATLTDERREAFMKLRGLETWKADTWVDAAGEHAANVIAWGLSDRAIGTRLMPNDVESMRDAFVLLTGGRPSWERRLDISDHGVALDARSFVDAPGSDHDSERADPASVSSQERASIPQFAERLLRDNASVRELSKPDLRAVAGSNGRVGFLVEEAADSFRSMRVVAEQNGVSLTFVSAWRSWSLQDKAHQHFVETGTNLAGNPVPNVAHPDTSNHPRGLALDFALNDSVHRWLQANAHRFGWYPISSEAWHWEYRGAPDHILAGLDPAAPLPIPVDDALAAIDSDLV